MVESVPFMHKDNRRLDPFPITLAAEITRQTPYSEEQALRGIYGMLSCYGNNEDTHIAINEFIKYHSIDLRAISERLNLK